MRLLGFLALLVLVALLGAGLQSYSRMDSGPTFVDAAMRKLTGRQDAFDKARDEVDRMLGKARRMMNGAEGGTPNGQGK